MKRKSFFGLLLGILIARGLRRNYPGKACTCGNLRTDGAACCGRGYRHSNTRLCARCGSRNPYFHTNPCAHCGSRNPYSSTDP